MDSEGIIDALMLVPAIATKATIILTYIYWRISTKYIYKYATENSSLDTYDEEHAKHNIRKWKLIRIGYSLMIIPLFYLATQELMVMLIKRLAFA